MSAKIKFGVIRRFGLILLLIPLWVILRSAYRDRIGAFGCFDDCFNIMGGYYLLSGKRLFSEIFFNHMPLMAEISAWIQAATKPESIYMLLYQHRMFMISASIVANVLLVARFGLWAFLFSVLYESTKGFVFGERFLAEGLIVYPIVYLFGLAWETVWRRKIHTFDVWVAVPATAVVVFAREPYVPLALFLMGTIVWLLRRTVPMAWPILLFTMITVGMIVHYGWSEFFFNVVTVNTHVLEVESKITGSQAGGFAAILLYPVLLFGSLPKNLFHQVETGLAVVFFAAGTLAVTLGWWRQIVWVLVVLALANVRTVAPGAIYYGAFHHIIWYALFICTAARVLQELSAKAKFAQVALAGKGALFILAFYAFFSPASYLQEKVDRQTELTTNYSKYYVLGEVVRRLSTQKDTLFLDGQDDLIYWQAKRYSSYPYSWYTSIMPFFPQYTEARSAMFASNPPQFYFGTCPDGSQADVAPPRSELYVRLLQNGAPSCLWVHKDTFGAIRAEQWQSVVEFSYAPPTK